MFRPRLRIPNITNRCRTAAELVEEYYTSIGGREFVHDEASKELEKIKAAPPRKRGRGPSGTAAAPKGKRGKTEKHPRSTSPPASLKFEPPTGSWEDEIKMIEGMEETVNGLQVFLSWRGQAQKTSHPIDVVYRRAPQRVGPLRCWTVKDGWLTRV